ncbi:MAG: hypothetical protein WCD18_23485 [Thermosynechococcaceae cyanobacterium]
MYLPTLSWRGRSPLPAASKPRIAQPERDLLAQQRFYQRCDRLVQILILRCNWRITWRSEIPVLTISCSNTFLYGQILHEIQALALALRPLHPDAKIRIYRPLGWIFPLEIKVDEILCHPTTARGIKH